MGGQETFIGATAILLIFNLIFYVLGSLPTVFSIGDLLVTFLLIGAVILTSSVIPYINAGAPSVKWFGGTILLLCMLIAFPIHVWPYDFNIGFGLATNLISLGTPDINNLNCIPFYFFLMIGLIAFIGGIMALKD